MLEFSRSETNIILESSQLADSFSVTANLDILLSFFLTSIHSYAESVLQIFVCHLDHSHAAAYVWWQNISGGLEKIAVIDMIYHWRHKSGLCLKTKLL